MIPGIDFFLKAKLELILHLSGLMVLEDDQPCFVQALKKKNDRNGLAETLSSIQLKKGIQKMGGNLPCIVG